MKNKKEVEGELKTSTDTSSSTVSKEAKKRAQGYMKLKKTWNGIF
jgi:hypothetical protein